MPSFGENLRRERESRKKDLAELARETRIGENYLEALEENAFDSLPGTSFGKLYIRAYARVLGFDPEPLIADYEREQGERKRAEAAKARRKQLERSQTAPPASPLARRRRRFQDAAARPTDPDALKEPEKSRPRSAPFDTAAARRRVAEIRREVHSRERPAEAIAIPDPPVEEAPRVEVAPPPAPPQKTKLPKRLRKKKVASERRASQVPPPVAKPEAKPSPSVAPSKRLSAPPPSPSSSSLQRPLVAAAVALTLIVVVWGLITVIGSGGAPDPASTGATPPPASVGPPVAAPSAPAIAAPIESEPVPVPVPEEVIEAPTPEVASTTLSISGFGVGTAIVDRRLKGEGDRFEEGRVVFFYTRVLGGASGDTIRHVWLRNGRAIQAVDLKLGGSHWRTHSKKTLWGEGEWTVEARDADGHVLASSTFQSVPRGS